MPDPRLIRLAPAASAQVGFDDETLQDVASAIRAGGAASDGRALPVFQPALAMRGDDVISVDALLALAASGTTDQRRVRLAPARVGVMGSDSITIAALAAQVPVTPTTPDLAPFYFLGLPGYGG